MSVLIRWPGRLGFWWRTGAASEPTRETVRLHCAQAWSEYAAVLYLGRRGVSYDVPGRRRDGTRRHRRPVRWLVHVVGLATEVLLLRIVLLPVLLPALLVVEVLDGVGSVDAESWEFGQPKLTITGGPDTHAVALGDHVRRGKPDLWLVWSGARVAVAATDPKRAVRVLWQADDAAEHDVQSGSGVIDFSDGSTVSFVPSDAELDRLREFADRP